MNRACKIAMLVSRCMFSCNNFVLDSVVRRYTYMPMPCVNLSLLVSIDIFQFYPRPQKLLSLSVDQFECFQLLIFVVFVT